jgi:hypothetical protein
MVALLLALVVLSLGACGSTSSSSVHVTLTDTGVQAAQTSFQPNMTYHFVVTNHGGAPQTFLIMPQGMGGMPMGAMHQRAMVRMQDIAPGATVWIDYTFPMTMAHQSFVLGCYSAGHPVMWQSAQVQ